MDSWSEQHEAGESVIHTAAKLGNKCSDLLPVRALSECDTVSFPYGKGKVSAVNVILL